MTNTNKKEIKTYALDVFTPILKNAMKLTITSDDFREIFFDLAIDEVSDAYESDEEEETRQAIYDELENILENYINNFINAD